MCSLETAVNLGDKSVPHIAKLHETKLAFIPHCMGYKFAFEPISKNRDQGFWVTPRFDSPSEALTSLSQAIARCLLGFAGYSDVISSYWNHIFPEIVFERSKITKANNIQKMALTAMSDELQVAYRTRLLNMESDENRTFMYQFLVAHLKAGDNSGQKRVLTQYLSPKGTGFQASPNGGSLYRFPENLRERIAESDYRPTLRRIFDTDSTEEKQGAIRDILQSFPSKKGKEQRGAMTARSTLGRTARGFLSKRLKVLGNKRLSTQMEAWFRAFHDSGMQAAAAHHLMAQFDEFFLGELGTDTKDGIGDEDSSNESSSDDGD
jgi:hypothetical protein